MKKLIALYFLFFAKAVFSQSTIEVLNPSTNTSAFALKGEMNSTTQGPGSTGVRASNKGNSIFGIGLHASHDGNGYGVYSTVLGTSTFAIAGYFISQNSSGYALKTSGKVQMAGSSVTPGSGRALFSDADGNAKWEDAVIYTPWTTLSAAWRDTTVDGSFCKTNHLFLDCLSDDIVNQGKVEGFLKFGSTAIPMPYTSNAGNKANTLWFQIQSNKIQLYRTTHNEFLSPIGVSSGIEYRFVIIPGKSTCSPTNIFVAPTNPSKEKPCNSTVPCEN